MTAQSSFSPLWIGLAAYLLSACPAPTDTRPEDVSDDVHLDAFDWARGQKGPFNVGYRTIDLEYDAPGHDTPRSIKLSLWYPTEDESGTPAQYLDLLEDELAFVDASLAPSSYGETYPVHVHSHGNQGFAGSTNFLMRHFASHGWVVAAPDHKGNTLVDHIDPRPPWMYVVRSADITASLDTLANLPEGDPLRGRLKTDEVIMSGHSFGGYTTFASAGATFDMAKIEEICAEGCDDGTVAAFDAGVHDSRVVAAIPMAAGDSGMFGDSGYGSIACPLLLMTGSVDHPALNDEVWQGLSGNDAIRIDVEGGCHQLFGLGACDKISDEDGFAIVDEYALGFARYHLLGDASSSDLVDGVENVSEKVVFSQHTP